MNTQETNPDQGMAGRLMESHRNLTQLLDEICGAQDLDTLLPMLHQLRLELSEHFEQEEGPGGFGETVAESAPHRAEAVNRLFTEHTEFLQTVHRIQDAARACLAGPVAEVHATARDLCQKIRDHEAEENDLLTEAINTDLGGRG